MWLKKRNLAFVRDVKALVFGVANVKNAGQAKRQYQLK